MTSDQEVLACSNGDGIGRMPKVDRKQGQLEVRERAMNKPNRLPDSLSGMSAEAEEVSLEPFRQSGIVQAGYLARLRSGELKPDEEQAHVVVRLDHLANTLVERRASWLDGRSGPRKWLALLGLKQRQPDSPVTGLYLWGDVGRGKTYLLDLFYDVLPFNEKLRLHFHRFMQIVHEELKALGDLDDPLAPVADRFAARALVICLDELQVNDIGDAMLLGRLFEHLFARGVTLVVTSNQPPQELYRDGLQRARFIPAIKLLERHTETICFTGHIDYRLRLMKKLKVWIPAEDERSDNILREHFCALRGVNLHADRSDIVINHRRIPVRMWADGIAWFDFDELCNTPRGTEDYSEIATFFHTVVISDIRIMGADADDVARRFINMIDEFYDQNVKLIVSAEAAPDKLYTGARLSEPFNRTSSRLIEMQSEEYISRRHRETLDEKEEGNVREPDNRTPPSQRVEIGGRDGPEPTRYGDWEKKGRCIDF